MNNKYNLKKSDLYPIAVVVGIAITIILIMANIAIESKVNILFSGMGALSIVSIIINGTKRKITPLMLTTVFFLLVFVIVTIFLLKEKRITMNDDLVLALSLGFLGYIAYITGYVLPIGKALSKTLPTFHVKLQQKKIALAIIFCLTIATVSLVVFLKLAGGADYLTSMGARRFTAPRGLQYILWGVTFAIAAPTYWFTYHYSKRKKQRNIFFFQMFFLSFLAFIFVYPLGVRTLLIYPIFSFIVSYDLQVKPFRLGKLLMAFSIITIIAIAYQAYRLLTAGVIKLAGMIEMLNNIDRIIRQLAYEFAIIDDLIFALNTWPIKQKYLLGLSYISPFILPLPRIFWPSKPTLSVAYFVNVAKFGKEIASAMGGTTITAIGEGYVNFGPIGVMVNLFIIGVISRTMYCYVLANKDNPIPILVYVAFLYCLFLGLRGEFSLAPILFAQLVIPSFFIYYVSRLRLK